MRIAVAAVLSLAPVVAMAAASAPQQPPPLVQACAQTATEQMQQAIVGHSRAIEAEAEIARLKAEAAKKPVTPAAP